MPLSDIAIRNAKPGATDIRLFDGGGLFLLITPKGAKWWRFKYRFDSKSKLLSFGVYPEIGLKEAREWISQQAGRWTPDHAPRVLTSFLRPTALRSNLSVLPMIDDQPDPANTSRSPPPIGWPFSAT